MIKTENRMVAHPRGFEPLASAFGGQRSIQLSYGCLNFAIDFQTLRRNAKASASMSHQGMVPLSAWSGRLIGPMSEWDRNPHGQS